MGVSDENLSSYKIYNTNLNLLHHLEKTRN